MREGGGFDEDGNPCSNEKRFVRKYEQEPHSESLLIGLEIHHSLQPLAQMRQFVGRLTVNLDRWSVLQFVLLTIARNWQPL